MSEQNSKPIKSFKAGSIEASIWKQEVKKNGQTVIGHSVRIQKQFRNKDKNYEKTDYYFRDDLPKLILVAQKAFDFIALGTAADAEEETPS
ncbi:MAG: hypothetical protein ACYC54_12950 [Sedimentisphaerales bacterium]